MNWNEIYDKLIKSRQNRILDKDIYTETHHIIPRCMSGNDDKNNLIELTAREHYIAHLILYKIYPNN